MTGELELFCRRVLGDGPVAAEVALAARRAGGDRVDGLRMAARLCRDQPAKSGGPPARTTPEPGEDLRRNVAAEMAAATRRLPERQREVLALRDALRLAYPDIAAAMEMEPVAVAPLLARARLRLRATRRGTEPVGVDACPEADRALRVLACRQDAEPLQPAEEDWLHAHLAGCATCEMAQGAMLEAASCYRAWPVEPVEPVEPAGAR